MEESHLEDTKVYTPEAPPVTPEEAAPDTPAPTEPWREPAYTAPASVPQYSYSPTYRVGGYGAAYARQQEAARNTAPSPRGTWSAGKSVALVLVCSLLCTVLGAWAGYFTAKRVLSVPAPMNQVVLGNTEHADTALPSPAVTGAGNVGAQIYEAGTRQVVGITTDVKGTNIFGQPTSTPVSGTGFLISADGYILTNFHVAEYSAAYGYEMTVHFYDGASYPASLVSYEPDSDIAVLKIDAQGLEPVSFCTELSVGEEIYVIGNPLGELTYTETSGIVSAMDRAIRTDSYTTLNVFQIDAAVNSGNSGGPVYNARGQVIGIVTAKYASAGVEGIGFAIPIEDAIAIATQLIEQGYVSGKAYLGVSTQDVSPSVASYFSMPMGVYVQAVSQDSAAERGGIKVGDIIVDIDDRKIDSTNALKSVLRDYRAGDPAVIHVYRSGETLELDIVFDESIPAEKED